MRFVDWEERLHRYVENARQQRGAWGRHDCATFAAGCISAMTGRDLYGAWRGMYSARTYRAAMQAVIERLPLREIVPPLASRGDLVLLRRRKREGFGIVTLHGDSAWAAGRCGVNLFPLSFAVRAWRI